MTSIFPLSQNGLRFEQRPESPGVLFAVDEKKKTLAWQTAVHSSPFTSAELAPSGDELVLGSQTPGLIFVVNLKKHTAKVLHYPVTLSKGAVKLTPKGWVYQVTMTLVNTLQRPLQLDGPSVGEDSYLTNSLFEVTADATRRIEYRGEMAKRGPPDSFITVNPGQKHTATLDLTEAYPVPATVKHLSIAFSHQNHFSPDDFSMRTAVPLELDAPRP